MLHIHSIILILNPLHQVIAYAMKEYEMSLEEALVHVKEKRPVIRPNKAFMEQLKTYEGILEAR